MDRNRRKEKDGVGDDGYEKKQHKGGSAGMY